MHRDQQLSDFIIREALPDTYREDARRWFVPLADWLLRRTQDSGQALLLGVNGAQGTGKSTLAGLLTELLSGSGLTVANLSIDDFYLSKAARREKAANVHPLFASRGVPGTHDAELLLNTIQDLRSASCGATIPLPRFDKASDDCVPREDWPAVTGPVAVIVLEGWFVGVPPETEAALAQPVNSLEREEDPEGVWRRSVNTALAGAYQQVFADLDYLVMLEAPSFAQVYEWRCVQESKLRQRSPENAPGLMSDAALRRFVQHFERLTRHGLTVLPDRADRVYALDRQHRVTGCRSRD